MVSPDLELGFLSGACVPVKSLFTERGCHERRADKRSFAGPPALRQLQKDIEGAYERTRSRTRFIAAENGNYLHFSDGKKVNSEDPELRYTSFRPSAAHMPSSS